VSSDTLNEKANSSHVASSPCDAFTGYRPSLSVELILCPSVFIRIVTSPRSWGRQECGSRRGSEARQVQVGREDQVLRRYTEGHRQQKELQDCLGRWTGGPAAHRRLPVSDIAALVTAQ